MARGGFAGTKRLEAFGAARILADRARGLRATSSAVATSGLRVVTLTIGTLPHTHTGISGGQVHPCESSWNRRLTMRSSSEWYEITHAPGRVEPAHRRLEPALEDIEPWLTSMRMAWKLRLAG